MFCIIEEKPNGKIWFINFSEESTTGYCVSECDCDVWASRELANKQLLHLATQAVFANPYLLETVRKWKIKEITLK